MSRSRTWLPWATLFGAIAAIEILVRVAVPFSLKRVLIVEAVLFMASAFVTFALIQRAPASAGWRRRLPWILFWAFMLGSVRAAMWASGQPVIRANLITGLLVIVVMAGRWIGHRRRAGQPPQVT